MPSLYLGGAKRAFDIFLVLLAAPFALFLVVILALVTAFDGHWPLFNQMRVGKNGHLFRCWKIRTMVPNSACALREYLAKNPDAKREWQENQKLKHDPRITNIGRFLRKTSLDELPQLWNILKGDMSIVGPRPIVPEEVEKYGDSLSFYLSLRPGLTGLWQTGGRNSVLYSKRVSMDVSYQKSVSFRLDALIIARTVKTVLSRSGQ